MDSAERELVRLTLELYRLRERTTALEHRRDELAAYLSGHQQLPELRPAVPAWAQQPRQPNPDDPLDTATWLERRDSWQHGEATTNIRPEQYRTGALSALSQEIPCPPGCTRDYEHQHYADGQVLGFMGGG